MEAGHQDGTRALADLNAADRERLALHLRLQGYDFDEIADECGYTHRSAARKAYRRALARIPAAEAKEMRETINARYDWLMRQLMAGKVSPAVVQAAVAVERARSSLFGVELQRDTGNVAAAQVIVQELPREMIEGV